MANNRRNAIASAISHPRRKAVVRCLVKEYLPIPVPSFATYLALSLFPDAEADNFETFRIELQDDLTQTHLPKLDGVGIIDHDPDLADGVIDKGPEFENAVELVDSI